MMSDNLNKIEQEDLEKVTGGTGNECSVSNVIYEPTHNLTECGISDVNYEPTHDLDKTVKNVTGAVKR